MKERWTVNKVLLAGRLTRDPEMRALASGKHVTQFTSLVVQRWRGAQLFQSFVPRAAWCRPTFREAEDIAGGSSRGQVSSLPGLEVDGDAPEGQKPQEL
jgi:Single-strand binding protein family